jgi:hypothetical protein
MFATYFEWQVEAGREDEFRQLWSAGTAALRGEGSWGSALFQSGPSRFHAFARWPDKATRDTAFACNIRPDIFDPFRQCIEQSIHWIEMDLVEDQWVDLSK